MLAQFSGLAFCVPLSLAVIGIGVIILARFMPRRTKTGSEEVARWRAFKRYLQNLEKYTKVEDATEIFEQYLPYAVAFGLEQSFIRKFEKVDAPPPTWWIPYEMSRPYHSGGGGGSASGGHVPGHAAPMPSEGGSAPSLDGMSRSMGSSLAGMSAGLGTMLSQASNTLTSTPSSSGSGGGFSGGGFSAAVAAAAAAVAAAGAVSDRSGMQLRMT